MKRLEYSRTMYIDRLMPFIGKPVIKIITGMRRVGKSYSPSDSQPPARAGGPRDQHPVHRQGVS